MTTYDTSDNASVQTAFSDPEGDTVTCVKINGSVIDWVANGGVEIVALTEGSAHVYENWLTNPPQWVNTDPANFAGYPADGGVRTVGSFTYETSDGHNPDQGPFTHTMQIRGNNAAPPPTALAFSAWPVLSGTPQPGNTLTTSDGTVIGGTPPYTYSYAWKNGDAAIVNDPGDVNSYAVTSANNGQTLLHCNVTVTDAVDAVIVGQTPNVSVNVPLANTVKPSFSGTPTVGSTLTVNPGTWVGTGSIIVDSYQLYRDGAPISGLSGMTYVVQAGDEGHVLTVGETVHDTTGSASATSTGVTIYAAGASNEAVEAQIVMDEFNSDPDKGWAGFTSEAGFTIITVNTLAQLKAQWDAFRTGTPATSKVKVYLAWNGISGNGSQAWSGVQGAKLTAGATHGGYLIPSGGFWIAGAPGYAPIIGARLDIIGAPRIMFQDLAVSVLGTTTNLGNNSKKSAVLNFRSTGTFPVNGCKALKNVNFGLFDNRPTDFPNFAEWMKGYQSNGGYSTYLEDCRCAGTTEQFSITDWYRRMIRCEAQQCVGDFTHSFGFAGPTKTCWHWESNSLNRDLAQIAAAAGLHTDAGQYGVDTENLAAYRSLIEYKMQHANSSVATDSGSQGLWRGHSPSPTRYDEVQRDLLLAYTAYHGAVCFDPSGQGKHVTKRALFARAGLEGSGGQDTYEQILIQQKPNNGGSIEIDGIILTQIQNNVATPVTVGPNMLYVDWRAGVSTNGNGQSQNSPLRPEAVFTSLGITRNGQGRTEYTIPGEASTDFATAFYAIRDAFEPDASFGGYTGLGLSDPENWPGAPVRP
jgi:hypothetical protein